MTNLTIEFGGLCMFVWHEAPDPPGFYALLPDKTQDPQEWHCPMVLVPTTDPALWQMTPLSGELVGLSTLDKYLGPSGGRPNFANALNVTEYTKRHVANEWLTKPVRPPLATRVELPIKAKVTVVHPDGWTAIGDCKTMMPRWKVAPAGRVRVEMGLQNYPQNTVRVGPVEVDVTKDVEIFILNIPFWDLNRTGPRVHATGEMLHHPHAYYKLLEAPPAGSADDPCFWVWKIPATKPDPCNCPPQPAPTAPQLVPFNPPPFQWVDTHDCTIGTGT